MFKEEIIELLNLIKNTDGKDREEIIASNFELLSASFYALTYAEKKELITLYSGILYDMGLIASSNLSEEERLKRRNAAMNKPKFNETEEKIRQIFIRIFGIEPYWLKSKKSRSKIPDLYKSGPAWDDNIYSGYLCAYDDRLTADYKLSGTFICLPNTLPAFYIYIGNYIYNGNLSQDIFLFMQKKEGKDLESLELNHKAIEFLVEVQKSFAAKTPDVIYLSSYSDEVGDVLWMETGLGFKHLLSHTGRTSSGWSNIVSLSDEAINMLKSTSEFDLYQKEIEKRFIENGNPTTITMLNELRTSFDNAFNKEINPKRVRVNPESEED